MRTGWKSKEFAAAAAEGQRVSGIWCLTGFANFHILQFTLSCLVDLLRSGFADLLKTSSRCEGLCGKLTGTKTENPLD